MRALGIKPVAAGTIKTPEGMFNADTVLLREYSSVQLPHEQINPVLLPEPIAPHISAQREGINLSVDQTLKACARALDVPTDYLLVEGAGGWLVPLNDQHNMADLAQAMGFDVLLVVRMRLGCLNHALLTAESITARGLNIAGWFACVCEQMPYLRENIDAIKDRVQAPCLGVAPPLHDPKPEIFAKHIDTSLLP